MTERLSQQQKTIVIALARRGRGYHQLSEIMDAAGLRGLNERGRNTASSSYSLSLKELWQRGLVDRWGRLYCLNPEGLKLGVELVAEALQAKAEAENAQAEQQATVTSA